jgi:hypothetical protein
MLDTLLTLSRQEVNHANMLHTHVERLIKDYRNEHGEPPEAMLAVYNWEHEKMIDAAARTRVLQEMTSGK